MSIYIFGLQGMFIFQNKNLQFCNDFKIQTIGFFNYHLEQIEDVETVDWDVIEQIFGNDDDFAGSEVSINANVSTSLKEAKQENKK